MAVRRPHAERSPVFADEALDGTTYDGIGVERDEDELRRPDLGPFRAVPPTPAVYRITASEDWPSPRQAP